MLLPIRQKNSLEISPAMYKVSPENEKHNKPAEHHFVFDDNSYIVIPLDPEVLSELCQVFPCLRLTAS